MGGGGPNASIELSRDDANAAKPEIIAGIPHSGDSLLFLSLLYEAFGFDGAFCWGANMALDTLLRGLAVPRYCQRPRVASQGPYWRWGAGLGAGHVAGAMASRGGNPFLFLLFQETLGVEGCHAARSCAGDGLAVDVVLHVAGGEHAVHAGLGGKAFQAALGDDVAGLVHFQVALEDFGVGRVADGDEAALQGDVFYLAVLCALDADAGHAALVAQHFVEGEVGLEFDLAFLDLVHELVDQDGLGLELVAAVDQGDLAGDVGQIQRLFDGGVAAADHADGLLAVEEAVAGGAGRHALAHEGFFGRQAEVTGGCAGGDDQRVTGVGAAVAGEGEGALAEVDLVDVVEHDAGLEALGVLQKALHQLGALHAHHVGGPVVHFGGGHELAALGQAGDQQRLEVGARGVDGGGVASGAGAEDQDFGVFGRSVRHDVSHSGCGPSCLGG
ncbi:hypothetical protein SDC9_82173 [bioreactor metagenome]|uniref:Uncharacterized protein n=1 Tax=bioreactor metagenome TaxID=1076179 RepID=A0A644Z3W6_9ZZZZ